ncbi:cytochrome b/b6 domain-containing protein [Sphingomonas sp.]|uniref:cytochrome b/b6 domain-containing protein n=1 Tax=Sphingomonas sp. TaxID=28214 RepID=UPI00286A29CB|nr:cytochrome b/b6 domain-containing protein [Sphingomonas sp.]
MKASVWDLPVRLFHWLLAGLIGFSWWSVKFHHTDWHIWSGIAILTLLVFRLLWGFFGSSTARFGNFVRGPRAVRAYLRGNSDWRIAGHTPLGGLSVIAMLGAVAIQVGLGLISTDPDGLYEGPLARLVSLDATDTARDIHEYWFYVVLALIVMHLGAIIYYKFRGQKLVTGMITGRLALKPDVAPMRPGKWWVALLCLAAAFAVTRWIVAGAPPFSP